MDERGLIFEEYLQNLSLKGQPGTGDMFMKWVFDHAWDPEYCERRSITALEGEPRGFQEFPEGGHDVPHLALPG